MDMLSVRAFNVTSDSFQLNMDGNRIAVNKICFYRSIYFETNDRLHLFLTTRFSEYPVPVYAREEYQLLVLITDNVKINVTSISIFRRHLPYLNTMYETLALTQVSAIICLFFFMRISCRGKVHIDLYLKRSIVIPIHTQTVCHFITRCLHPQRSLLNFPWFRTAIEAR